MSVTIRCPNCRRKYEVRGESLGGRATCKKCGQTFTVELKADETFRPKPREDQTPPHPAERSGHIGAARELSSSAEASSDAAQLMPQKIGSFEIRRRLGGGAMGEVWLAWDPALQREVAIKTLRAEVARSSQGLERFLREARLTAKLHHTNAVAVYEVGVEGQTAYIAMEYVAGQSLDKAVSLGQPLEWREATRAIRDAAAGLAAAHKLGLIHRDVKPANLMRTTDGVTKVVDFGLARAEAGQTQLTQQGVLLGTPAYMAPELWRRAEADPRSDVYALACTYYCLLTGDVPFDADNFVALGYQHTHEPLPDPRQRVPDLPNGVCRILAKGASKEPDKRYQSAAEMQAELEAMLASPADSLLYGGLLDLDASELESLPKLPDSLEPDPLDPDPLGGTPLPARSVVGETAVRRGSEVTVFSRAKSVFAQGLSMVPARIGLERLPKWVGLTMVSAVAAMLMLGIVLSIRTGSGTVKIELSHAQAQVQVKVDGDTIDITGLKEPLRLKAGEHELLVESGDYRSVSQSFTVRRGEEQVLRVTLEPKTEVVKEPASVETTKPRPAVYEVAVDPPQAQVVVTGKGASIAGSEAARTITVVEPDAKVKIVVAGSLENYEPWEQELTPGPGTVSRLSVQLKPRPAVYSVAVDPPQAEVSVTGAGASIEGNDAARTITVADPDGQARVTVIARLAGYESLERELQPKPGELGRLTLRLKAPLITNSIGMKLALIPAGEFLMGSPESDRDAMANEKPQHRVRITKPFYLGIYEVTQADYQRVTGANPSQLKDPSGAAPVGSVSWDDAQGFCARLSGLPEEQQAGRRYRLPTEAEWEYACRAGSTSRYGFGEAEADLGAYAWYQGNSDGKPHPVGQKKPNAWGLHDMYGNVWEWCADWYGDGYYAASPTDDPAGPGTGSLRVLRGGCWQNGASGCRPSCRCRIDPGNRYGYQGFRLAMTVSSPKPKDPPPPLAVAPFSKSEAKQHQRRWADFLGVPVLQRNSIDMQLTLIPAGEFLMGSPDSDGAESAMEIPQHPVRITKPFYLGVHEVTQAEYQRVMGTKPSQFKDPRGAAPVESVSWEDAHGFCAKLSGLPEEQQAGRQYRLPTEAEWEYACRAGSRFRYGFGEAEADLDAWYTRNSGRRTHPVGKTKPNAWGLYDMHGNVWEWCADWYADGYFATSPTDDPAGPASGSYRVTRGGGWRNDASLCRASSRFRYEPGFRNENLGFRLARTVSLP